MAVTAAAPRLLACHLPLELAMRRLPTALLLAALLPGLAACNRPDAAADTGSASAVPEASTADKVAAAADAVNPLSSPREEVIAAMRKFMDARSYHAVMHIDGGPQGQVRNEVDFVAPDRMRMQMAGIGTQVVIGDTMYMTVDGRSMQVPMPKGTLTKWRDPGNFKEAEATLTAQARGSETIDGVSARKYVMQQTLPQPSETTLWIGPDGMPLRMQSTGQANGKPMTTLVHYSRINDPTIRIDAPQ